MISKKIDNFCSEDPSLIENYEEAVNDKRTRWHCHHRYEITVDGKELLTKDELIAKGLYYNRPASELIFLKPADHIKMHMDADNRFEKISQTKKENREQGKNLVNIYQQDSPEAYRDYQRLQHRSWYDRNREEWNDYTYRRQLNNKSMAELERLLTRHQNSILLNEKTGNKERIDKLNHYIDLINSILRDKLEEINKNTLNG